MEIIVKFAYSLLLTCKIEVDNKLFSNSKTTSSIFPLPFKKIDQSKILKLKAMVSIELEPQVS